MRLLEYESKEALASKGIPIPKGILARDPEEAASAVEKLGGRGVLKIQIPHGQRGRAGGIKLVNSPNEAREVAKELFSRTFYGYEVSSLLVEEPIDTVTEIYIGGIIDRNSRGMTFISTPYGGMDVEEIAASHPESIEKRTVHPLIGMRSHIARALAKNAAKNVPDKVNEIQRIISSLWDIAVEYDAMMLEINPLALTKDGRLVALDARIEVDDNALFRHMEFEKRYYSSENPRENEARKRDIAYVELDGNIGTMANGAGLAMATMDMVHTFGGKPANFCDVGGGASAERVANALEIILSNPRVSVVLINTLCGITSALDVALGVKSIKEKGLLKIPVVVRMSGNQADEGKRILEEIGIKATESAEEAVKYAVELAKRA
ncbi:MAG: ADP-forming succinate--CoA ligase subunit beta [Candidatus Korarchaeum sp.]|jgi:succinyl-CoA synthetase beta subunit|nr:ADP-forming succinate--CoA ligase subunit beta [Candidatus Korarchaeum sp.]